MGDGSTHDEKLIQRRKRKEMGTCSQRVTAATERGESSMTTMCIDRKADTHEGRARQLPHGAMTGGNQPTNIRGIDRRRKVPEARCLQVPCTSYNRGP